MKNPGLLLSTTLANQKFTRVLLYLLTPAGLMTPNSLRADCVPSAPNGYTVPFTMTTLKNYAMGEASATYATGWLTANNSSFIEVGIGWSGTNIPQLFSNRYVQAGCGLFSCSQPFDISQADKLGVSIFDGYSLFSPQHAIKVTLTFESQGNAQTFPGACDATTGELYGAGGGNTFVTIAFGAPQPPPTSPRTQ